MEVQGTEFHRLFQDMEDQGQLDQKATAASARKLIMNNTGLFVPPGSGNSFIEQPYSIFKPTLTCLASLYLRTSQCICYCCHIGICKKCRFVIKGMETASSESVVQTLGDKMGQSTVE